MDLVLKAYYGLIDDCSHSATWVRKIEEDIGQNIAFLTTAFDESVRDELVENSELFHRFVRLIFVAYINIRILKNRNSSSELNKGLERFLKKANLYLNLNSFSC